MLKSSRIVFAIATLLILAGLFYLLRSLGGDDDVEPLLTRATEAPVVMMSTDGVIDNITRRLEENEGRKIRVTCPKEVAETIGTTFSCDVFFVDREDAIATAHVTIDGPGGEFSWKSEAKVKAKESK